MVFKAIGLSPVVKREGVRVLLEELQLFRAVKKALGDRPFKPPAEEKALGD